MKRITLEALDKKLKTDHYDQLYQAVLSRIEAGEIKPLKASGLNGKHPALYREYWLIEPEAPEELVGYEDELKYRMHTGISIAYYLHHLLQYKKDRKWVLMLNEYLFTHDLDQLTEISMNERSFEIWGREKFLRQEQGRTVLKRCGLSLEALCIYDTTEPLAYYSFSRDVPQNILILENKDTFYSMRRFMMEEEKNQILGKAFGTLIYGAGKGILRSFRDFSFCAEPYMRNPKNQIYYFGDLDYEGIRIYEQLADTFAKACTIRPFAEAYERCLEKAAAFAELPDTKEGQNRNLDGQFYRWFTAAQKKQIEELLEAGRYIPQEILNIGDLCTTIF